MSSVDVIVPCYNYGRYLRQCVESALSQEGVDVRVLIIDDASSDDTSAVAARLAAEDRRVTFIRHFVNKGHIATYNEGIEWISSDYYLLLSADDYLLPDALRQAVCLLDNDFRIGLVFGKAYELYEDAPVPSSQPLPASPHRVMTGLEFIEFSGARNKVPTPTAVVRTDLQKRVDGYRHELPHSGDMEMWLRLAAHAQVGQMDVWMAVQRKHSTNMSLAYYSKHWLPDLVQRKAAIEHFIRNCRGSLGRADEVQARLFRLLALDAMERANDAFGNEEFELSTTIQTFALSIDSRARNSSHYLKLALKCLLGRRIWQTIRPILQRQSRAESGLN